MKPYTLEWWMDILLTFIDKEETGRRNAKHHGLSGNWDAHDVWMKRAEKYNWMSKKVHNRIIKKYGEK